MAALQAVQVGVADRLLAMTGGHDVHAQHSEISRSGAQ
jgi:hypothetical protein